MESNDGDTETATIERRSIATGGAQHAEDNTNGEPPNRILVLQIGADAGQSESLQSTRDTVGLV